MTDVYNAIIDSSAKFTDWQRDALRRLLVGSVSDTDYAELVELAIDESLPVKSRRLSPQPLTLEHVSLAHAGGGVTTLLEIAEVQGVNALANDQQIILGERGVTIVFGRNGAGKSGYSRLLRRACRARKAPPILPNITSDRSSTSPSASFRVRHENVESRIVWREGAATPKELARLAVFDRECERDIVDENGEATFVPPELAVFDELVRLVDSIKQRITEKQAGATPTDALRDVAQRASPSPDLTALLQQIRPDLSEEDYAAIERDLKALQWSEQLEGQLAKDRSDLAIVSDPATRLKSLRSLAESMKTVFRSLRVVSSALDDAAEAAIRAKIDKVRLAKEAERLANLDTDFASEPAKNIGSNAWRNLYSAAVAFALEGFPEEPRFPASDSPCPLCLQGLDASAKARLDKFRGFMSASTKASASAASASLSSTLDAVRQISPLQIDATLIDSLESLLGFDRAHLVGLDELIVSRRDWLLSLVSDTPPTDVARFPESPLDRLAEASTSVANLIAEVEQLVETSSRDALAGEVARLHALKQFTVDAPRVVGVLDAYRTAASLGRVAAGISTRQISIEGKNVADKLVTDGLRDAFSDEMRRLGAQQIVRVNLKPTALKGKTTFGISLSDAKYPTKTGGVLSEGEQRVVALAYFLAEARIASDKVGLIFDDPVSSLDHWWAERIAQRIAEIGVDRQMIVFTHSVAFAVEIEKHATFTRTPVEKLYIEKGADGAGRCSPDAAPWDNLSVGARLDHLKARISALRTLHLAEPTGREYAREAAVFCGDLRSTWERAIEEHVFCGVIERFGNTVSLGRLKSVSCTTETFRMAHEAVTKLSAITNAHDKARGAFATCPNPDELLQLLGAAEKFVAYQKQQKKLVEAERKPFEAPPSV